MSMYESFMEPFRMKVTQVLPQEVANLACDHLFFWHLLNCIARLGGIINQAKIDLPICPYK